MVFNGVFEEDSEIPITVSTLADQRGNSLADPIQTTFDYQSFHISQISALSINQLEIIFNKTPNETDLASLSNYILNLDQNPTTVEIEPMNKRKVTLTFPNPNK